MNRAIRTLLAITALSAVLLAACTGGDSTADDDSAVDMATEDRGTPVAEIGQIAIYAPYVPAPPADIAALYLVIVNEGEHADRLITISTDAAGMATLHETVIDGDSARMSPLDTGLEIPSLGEATLAPGGYHGMLMNLIGLLAVGDIVHVTLEFELAGTVAFEVPVTDGVPAMEGMSQDDE